MAKKMNQTEIKAVAKKILQEVNEVNEIYNESVINSQTFKDEIERIKRKDPLLAIREDFEKQLKIQFGTKYDELVNFSLNASWGSLLTETQVEIQQEIKEYKKTNLKPLYDEKSNKLEEIINEITIAQISISDIQLLINTIKAKLI